MYLFAPLCNHLKESDFQNVRHENGVKIWQAMWEFRHPDALCFTTQVKPKPKYLSGRTMKNKPHFGDVFVGREFLHIFLSVEDLQIDISFANKVNF